MSGVFDLQSPKDVLGKLERELERLRIAPNDKDAAINFFITAESMLDWKFPGDPNALVRKEYRNREPLLLVVWDLASKSKHRDLRSQHKSVESSGMAGKFFGGSFFEGPFFGTLSVTLTETYGNDGPRSLSALELAGKVFEYWKAHC